MNERPSAGSGVVGYVVVLVGVIGFVASCFLPYTRFGPAAGSSNSYYDIVTFGRGTFFQHVGALLFLFGVP